jgi:hypothetical protein
MFYKNNIKCLLVSIYCDINTLEVVELLEKLEKHLAMPCVPLKLLMLYNSHHGYITAYRHMQLFDHIPYMITFQTTVLLRHKLFLTIAIVL